MADLKRRTLQFSSGKQVKLFGNSVAISKSLEIGEGYAPNILSIIEEQPDNKISAGLSMLAAGIENLLKLECIYQNREIEKKREVIGSMYPGKLTFDKERLRTTCINEAARIIYTLDKAFSENEKGQSGNIPALSSQVGTTGFEPATPCTPCKCATGLRYVPNVLILLIQWGAKLGKKSAQAASGGLTFFYEPFL
jgi:hypothetical protein